MKTIKTVWKIIKIIGKVAAFLVTNQSWRDLIADCKATWKG